MNVKKVPSSDYTIVVTLHPKDADNLYNDIYALLREIGVHNAHDRTRPSAAGFQAIYALYDSLESVGVDGAGWSA